MHWMAPLRLATRHIWVALTLFCAFVALNGCARYAYTNHQIDLQAPANLGSIATGFKPQIDPKTVQPPKAAFAIVPRHTKKQGDVLVLLALSGGGSRAGYFSARSMLALSQLKGSASGPVNVLNEVDLVSSVSGGSLAAAYYATSYDDDPAPPENRRTFRRWSAHEIDDAFGKNYIARWLGNWFWPTNIAKFWFTAYDRTDIMAQTLADNLFDTKPEGIDLNLGQINPGRPNLVLNSTIGSGSYDTEVPDRAKLFGTLFTFTHEDFTRKINSDIVRYEVSRAVMASATFPAAFNFMTLKDFSPREVKEGQPKDRYLHLFDGGNSDNLGLLSLNRVLLDNNAAALEKYQRVVVILIDAYRQSLGAPNDAANPRGILSYVVDTNFLDSTDALLEANRARLLKEYFSRNLAQHPDQKSCQRDNLPASACFANRPTLRNRVDALAREKLYFFHVNFDAVSDPDLRQKLGEIPTTFKLTDPEMHAIKAGVDDIFFNDRNTKARECVNLLLGLIADPKTSPQPEQQGAMLSNEFCGAASAAEVERRLQQKR